MDTSEQLIADSLSKHAADAPSDGHLLAAVHTRLRRRRTGRVIGAAVVAAGVVATAITASHDFTTEPPPQVAQNPAPAPGWRWESFKTVQVQVPASWTQYISGPAPCTFMANSAVPSIGRVNGWWASKEYTCTTAVLPLERRQPYLWFNDVQAPGIKHYDGGWTEETRMVGGVKLSVLSQDDALRRTILDSARPIGDTDYYGCSPQQPAQVPTSGAGLPPDGVTSASICEYWQGSLIAGSNLASSEVAGLISQLRALGRPRDPGLIPAGCQDPAPREYVIHLRAGSQVWPIRLSYTTCIPMQPPVFSLIRTGVHHQIQGADLFDPVRRITSLPR